MSLIMNILFFHSMLIKHLVGYICDVDWRQQLQKWKVRMSLSYKCGFKYTLMQASYRVHVYILTYKTFINLFNKLQEICISCIICMPVMVLIQTIDQFNKCHFPSDVDKNVWIVIIIYMMFHNVLISKCLFPWIKSWC